MPDRPKTQRFPTKQGIFTIVLSVLLVLGTAIYLASEMSEARSRVKTLKAEVEELSTKKESLSKERAKLKQEVSELTGERDKLKLDVEDAQKELAEAKNAIDQLAQDFENAPPELVIKQVLNASRGSSAHGRAMALYTAGRSALEQNRNDRARALFEASIREYSGYAPSLTALGRMLDPSDKKEAEALYRKAIAADPTYKYALHNLAYLLHLQWKNKEAMVLVEKALRIDPNFDSAKKLEKLIQQASSQ